MGNFDESLFKTYALIRNKEFRELMAAAGVTGVLNDAEIADLCKTDKEHPLISPFESVPVKNNVVSYGLGHYGYDFRLGFKFMAYGDGVRDPKKKSELVSIDYSHKGFDSDKPQCATIGPNDALLGHTLETFDMPKDLMGICFGKSTYARLGLIVNTTPIEPGWKGQITLCLVNPTNYPIRIYPGEGIGQIVFFRGLPVNKDYADKGGKYQNSTGIVGAKIDAG